MSDPLARIETNGSSSWILDEESESAEVATGLSLLIRTDHAAPSPRSPFYPGNRGKAKSFRRSVTFGGLVELLRQKRTDCEGGVERAPGETVMANNGTTSRRPEDAPVPLRKLQGVNEIDEMLRAVAKGTRGEVHTAIDAILQGWPGRKRREIWERLRWLRNGRNGSRGRHTVWSEEDLELLRGLYAGGRAGSRRAVRELQARHPDWSPRSVWRKAHNLGLSIHDGAPRPWSKDEDAKLRWDAGMKAVRVIARKLKRSESAVRQRLSINGESARVRIPKGYTLHQISTMLGVSGSIVRVWFEKGLFGEPNSQGKRNANGRSSVLISSETFTSFCIAHPEKINPDGCDADVLELLEEKRKKPGRWNGSRQHLTERKECPRCGRVIQGSGYYRHVRSCMGMPALKNMHKSDRWDV
jgi:hypothetical protein